jgi:dihydrofolate reductase
VEGNAYLPDIVWGNWVERSRERHPASAENPYDYSFIIYDRTAADGGST